MTERELYDGVIVEGTSDLFSVVDVLRQGSMVDEDEPLNRS